MNRSARLAVVLFLFVFAGLFFLPALARAADQAPPADPWAGLINQIIATVGAAIGAAVVYLVNRGIKAIEEKAKIDIDAATEKRALEWATRAAVAAEEWAAKKITAKGAAAKPAAEEKLAKAKAYITEHAPGLVAPAATSLIEAAIPFVLARATEAMAKLEEKAKASNPSTEPAA